MTARAGRGHDAKRCDLHWADDRAAGIRRRRAGKGFAYVDERSGSTVRDTATLARIRALAVPPAWTEVWICPDPLGHVQATGRDARGRKQYRYHADYRAHREAVKFEELAAFGHALPAIRRQVARDLARDGMPKEKVVATVIRLLEATLIRVGNEEYARTNGSYGLTTLRDRHARWSSDGTLELVFTGKHAKQHRIAVRDRRLARIVRRCRDLPGQVLFQYVDDDGTPSPISSADVNDYLRSVSGAPLSAKEFRTWMASLLAASALASLPVPASERAGNATVKSACEEVARHLGNTATICRASYVHPAVVAAFTDGSLQSRWSEAAPRRPSGLVADERRLLALVEDAATHAAALPRVDGAREGSTDGRAAPHHRTERPHRGVRARGREPALRRGQDAHARGGGRGRASAAAVA
jgi:DNA topoisomerase I